MGIILEDIAEILACSKDSELRSNVLRYLFKLNKPCPTPACNHWLTEGAFDCHGYRTRRKVVDLEGDVPKISEIESNPIVISVFCYTFCQLTTGKEPCKICRDGDFKYKAKFDGLYCHACGFFVDYNRRRVGYSDEWTTRSENHIEFGISCKYCAKQGVSIKFGDYWFCDAYCMQKWYFSIGSGTPQSQSGALER